MITHKAVFISSWWRHFWKQSHINIGNAYFDKYYYQFQSYQLDG